jgi:hypothetical protein
MTAITAVEGRCLCHRVAHHRDADRGLVATVRIGWALQRGIRRASPTVRVRQPPRGRAAGRCIAPAGSMTAITAAEGRCVCHRVAHHCDADRGLVATSGSAGPRSAGSGEPARRFAFGSHLVDEPQGDAVRLARVSREPRRVTRYVRTSDTRSAYRTNDASTKCLSSDSGQGGPQREAANHQARDQAASREDRTARATASAHGTEAAPATSH